MTLILLESSDSKGRISYDEAKLRQLITRRDWGTDLLITQNDMASARTYRARYRR
jgi:hypothetical protein